MELLPGKLAGLYDVRLQLWRRIDSVANALQNSKVHARAMLEGLAQGTLVLFDLGYFGFEWLDELTLRKLWWVSRLREKTSYTIIHTYYQSEDVFDGLVMLGVPIRRVPHYPPGWHTCRKRSCEHPLSQIPFRRKPHLLRNACFSATYPVCCPFLGQVQLPIHEGGSLRGGIEQKDTHLAVFPSPGCHGPL